ncbi:restriction endonuclease subunit M [Bacteroidia bacterium]|nr:restriction endonuclease subunit M [Bacteroidia bacterium]
MTNNKNIGIKYTQSTKLSAKPFIKWVGGKGQLISSIEKLLPNEVYGYSNMTYIEPFVGGGAMLFWILENVATVKKAIINDINPDLTTAYRTVKENVYELIILLKNIQKEYQSFNSEDSRKEFFLKMRERYNTKSLENIENTALFIFLNRTCFNGLYRVNSKGLFNVPFGKYTNPTICDENTLLIDSELLQKVEILTGDFEQTLNYATENSLFYLDPPYKPLSQTSSFNSYSKEEFNDAEQIRLKRFCDKLNDRDCMWILSNSDVKSNDPENDFFDDLYSHYLNCA